MNDKDTHAELVMRFRRASGLSVMRSKEYLRAGDADLVNRILAAYDRQVAPNAEYRPVLHDPIEDDPRYAKAFAEAEEEAQRDYERSREEWRRLFPDGGNYYGYGRRCYVKQCILRERFGIDWKTPREMNPCVIFE